MLVGVRALLSAPWPDSPSGQYCWQHCAYVDTADFLNTAQMALAVQVDMGLLYTEQVYRRALRIFELPAGPLLVDN